MSSQARRTLTSAMLGIVIAASAVLPLHAQVPRPALAAGGAARVFLDCEDGCDFDYLRVETPWVRLRAGAGRR